VTANVNEILKDMVRQHCHCFRYNGLTLYSSDALSANRDAFFYLVENGEAEIYGDGYGRQWTIQLREDKR
jgi:hypothetical protein